MPHSGIALAPPRSPSGYASVSEGLGDIAESTYVLLKERKDPFSPVKGKYISPPTRENAGMQPKVFYKNIRFMVILASMCRLFMK